MLGKGLGVLADERIDEMEMVGLYAGLIMPPCAVYNRDTHRPYSFFLNSHIGCMDPAKPEEGKGSDVDPRFASCVVLRVNMPSRGEKPNCKFFMETVAGEPFPVPALYTLKVIAPKAELTVDYGSGYFKTWVD